MSKTKEETAVDIIMIAIDALDEIVKLEDDFAGQPIPASTGRAIQIAGNARRKIADATLDAQIKKDLNTLFGED